MAPRARTRWSGWLEALRPDSDLAEAEGLAAGTGLLTGQVARAVSHRTPVAESTRCPACSAVGEVVVVDLVAHASTFRCTACGHRWTVAEERQAVGET